MGAYVNYGTAKTYADWERVGEPYKNAGFKLYIRVKNPKTGAEKDVRFYSPSELHTMYPDYIVAQDKWFKTQKEVLGFGAGYITIFKGDTYPHLEYFQNSPCRYNRWFGWFLPSDEGFALTEPLPEGIEAIHLDWSMVGTAEGVLLSDQKVQEAMDSLLYDASESRYQGAIGDRLEITVTVKSATEIDSKYGKSTLHVFVDDKGNEYAWPTTARSWEVGTTHHIRGQVKSFSKYHNIETTYLTRCVEVKEA